ncbi:MAG: hypothetical protein J6X72_04995, partial [Clostridia bacterium]|nr:hypothetical protein [Clostridia bacterium]
MKKILSAMRRAVQDFKMIEDGDKVAVGVSGGKDSLILFESLYRYSKFSPEKFTLLAVNVNMGFKETSEEELERLRAYFREKEVPFIEEKTDIAEIIFDVRKESNPCSLCSKLRRGALCSASSGSGNWLRLEQPHAALPPDGGGLVRRSPDRCCARSGGARLRPLG